MMKSLTASGAGGGVCIRNMKRRSSEVVMSREGKKWLKRSKIGIVCSVILHRNHGSATRTSSINPLADIINPSLLRISPPGASKLSWTVSAQRNPVLLQMTHRITGRHSIRGTVRRWAMDRDQATADTGLRQVRGHSHLWPAARIPFHHNMHNNITPGSRKTSRARIRFRLCFHRCKVLVHLRKP
jgi:hypothetical protein